MHILLTGANGYIGRRLLPCLVEAGHTVTCLVRDRRRFSVPSEFGAAVNVIEGDLLDPATLEPLPDSITAAYYLVHSMGTGSGSFAEMERRAAEHFGDWVTRVAGMRQIVYLSGIANAGKLSPHLASRRQVERVLAGNPREVPVTVLRAAIIVGSGSASFEIIRDLVEKLPVMIAPKWLRTRCQPIAIRNVIDYLVAVLGNESATGETFDIGGPDVLTYQEMLLGYAEARGLRRWILPVPVLTPRLSSYWLYFVTSTSFALARNLVDSMRVEVVCAEDAIRRIAPEVELISYLDGVRLAFSKIEQNMVISSWTDALASGRMDPRYSDQIEVPRHGVLRDARRTGFHRDPDEVQRNFWRIGGKNGWYALDWAWRIRGWLDRMVGGAGLRRGRRDPDRLRAGDALDFWRVLVADRAGRRLVLYAEMKLPGEAWLEWEIEVDAGGPGKHELRQTATFRPSGIWGRLYWYAISPVHGPVFAGMLREIVNRPSPDGTRKGA